MPKESQTEIIRKRQWWKSVRHWGYALLSSVIGGAATAAGAITGNGVANAMGIQMQAFDWKQIGAIALGGGLSSAVAFLMKSPLPPPPMEETITSRTETEVKTVTKSPVPEEPKP